MLYRDYELMGAFFRDLAMSVRMVDAPHVRERHRVGARHCYALLSAAGRKAARAALADDIGGWVQSIITEGDAILADDAKRANYIHADSSPASADGLVTP